MKKLIFREILLCSRKEKRAKRVKFHPERTLIFGKNDTGKSSLIKSIFITFGAYPAKQNNKWKSVNPTSLVKFSVDGINYSIIKENKGFAIFDSNDNLLKTFKSVTNELGPYLADLFGFKIKLPDRESNIITPPPAFIFLPFYVDQDSGWSGAYNSFAGLQQLKSPKTPILYYHTGIRPNEYYDAKGEAETYENQIKTFDDERKVTNSIIRNLKDKISSVDFNIDIDVFKDEIQQLLLECETLKRVEETHKESIVDLYNKKIILDTQIEITNAALSEVNKDYQFAISKLEHSVECPTCGAEYENSFSERFEIAQDANRCKELLLSLTNDLTEVEDKIERANSSLNNTIEEIGRIEALLNIKKGEVLFKDVIESSGRNEVNRILTDKVQNLTHEISNLAGLKQGLEERIKSFENKDRKENIIAYYCSYMSNYLRELEVFSLNEDDYKNIAGNINDTGSSLPRALTAYYFSIFETIKRNSTSVFPPLVIDSPNQQAQDIDHIERILDFINQKQPKDTQLILGLEELYDMDFGCPIIELNEKYHLLQEREFEDVRDELDSYLSKMFLSKGFLF